MEEIIGKCIEKWDSFRSIQIDFDHEVHVIGEMGFLIASFDTIEELRNHLNG